MRGNFVVNLMVRPIPIIKSQTDPRIAVAKHIGWEKKQNKYTDWSTPEPDNYNRGILSAKPCTCDWLKDQVVYYDRTYKKWWTLYYVPPQDRPQFDNWLLEQPWEIRWYYEHASAVRERKQLLTPDNIRADINLNERLFTLGYYATLHSKYFSEGTDDWLLSRMGTIRDCVLDGLGEIE